MSQSVRPEDLATAIGPWTERHGSLYTRLADAIEDAAAQGSFDEGARLPAERVLADCLGVSRGTVVSAYAQLSDRDVVARRQGSGTTLQVSRPVAGGRHHRAPQFNSIVGGPAVPIDLAFASPQVDEIALSLSADTAGAFRAGAPTHGYAALGLPGLRDGIADLLSGKGIPTRPDEVLVTQGAQGALQLLTTALVRRGDRVIIEAPTYSGAIEVFSRAGAVVLGVRRDHAGPRVEDLERLLAVQPPAFVFLTPTCHNPTGTTMSEQRRREVLAICRRHEVLVIEDLTLADLTFDGEAPAPISTLDQESVITIGSFSKIFWGGLRTGYIRADAALVLRIGRLKACQDMGSGLLDQVACLGALPRIDEAIRVRRSEAAARHAQLSGLLAQALPQWEQTVPRGGYSLWIRIPGVADRFAGVALSHGVAIVSGSACAPEDLFLDHIRLSFITAPEVIDEAVRRLTAAWDEETSTAGARPAAEAELALAGR